MTPYSTKYRDKDYHKAQVRHYSQQRKDRINALKVSPCADCKISYPAYVMDFDHRPGEVKCFDIAQGYWRNWTAVLAEIAKCDLVCSNCHRERTHVRAQTLPRIAGNMPRGQAHVHAKLTDAQALEIFNSNDTHRELARKHNVSKSCIWQIKQRVSWDHIHALRRP